MLEAHEQGTHIKTNWWLVVRNNRLLRKSKQDVCWM